jgi:hypothetical protein
MKDDVCLRLKRSAEEKGGGNKLASHVVLIPICLNQLQVKTVVLKWVITGQSQTSGNTLFLSTAVEHSFMKAHMTVVYCVTTGPEIQLHKASKLNNAIRR